MTVDPPLLISTMAIERAQLDLFAPEVGTRYPLSAKQEHEELTAQGKKKDATYRGSHWRHSVRHCSGHFTEKWLT